MSFVFFTRDPRLAFLSLLIDQHCHRGYQRTHLKALFNAVDDYCAEHIPGEERGGWFSPLMFGGAVLNHTPPHIMAAAYAIYADKLRGEVAPVPFLSQGINGNGATAIQIDPVPLYSLIDINGEISPITDLLLLVPTGVRRPWLEDAYGTPDLQSDVVGIGWHASSRLKFTAMAGGVLFLNQASRRVLNPFGPIPPEVGSHFFKAAPMQSKLQRHRERFSEFIGLSLEALVWNHDNVSYILEAYFSKFGLPADLSTI